MIARELPNCDNRADTRTTEPEEMSGETEIISEELFHSSYISDGDRERGMVGHHVEKLSGSYSSLHEATFGAVDLNVIDP